MTRRRPCPAAPGPLEDYVPRFDDLFGRLAQRRGFREYLAGLLAPRDRNKTLTALAGAETVAGAQHAAAQRLQFFLSECRWDAERLSARRLELLRAAQATAPHVGERLEPGPARAPVAATLGLVRTQHGRAALVIPTAGLLPVALGAEAAGVRDTRPGGSRGWCRSSQADVFLVGVCLKADSHDVA